MAEARRAASPTAGAPASPGAFERATLYAAVRSGSPARVKRVLEQAAQSTLGDDLGSALGTALHKAVSMRCHKVCQVLVDAGADVDARNSAAATPLHRAAEDGASDILALLLSSGASLTARNDDGKAPIAVAKNATTRAAIAAEARKRAATASPPAVEPPPAATPSPPPAASAKAKEISPPGPSSTKPPPTPPSARRANRRRKSASPLPLRARAVNASARMPSSPAAAPARTPPLNAPPSPGLSNVDGLDCLVCLRRYCTENGTEPVTLPCGHTFCQSCVQTLRGCPPDGGEGVPHSFRCPIDRQVYSRHLELRVNTTLRDLVQRLPGLIRSCSAAARSPLVRSRVENAPVSRVASAPDKGAPSRRFADASTSPHA